ncbi:Fc.00g080910.m01.CDS01 [Cosmosporella sp. VM-42]
MSSPTTPPSPTSSSRRGSGSSSSSEATSLFSDTWTMPHNQQSLACNTVWPDADDKDVTLERMEGGGYNHIVGLNRRTAGADESQDQVAQYILRIPRLNERDCWMDREVAIMRFVREHTKIPVPEVIMFDETTNNVLESPYMVQTRIQGLPTIFHYKELNHQEQCRFAQELGAIVRQMLDTQSSRPGKLALPADALNFNAPFQVVPLPTRVMRARGNQSACRSDDPLLITPYSNAPAHESIAEWLTTHFQARKVLYLEELLDARELALEVDACCRMVSELDSEGWFTNVPTSLAHLDFAPRNVLINPTSDTSQPIISAILDWDSAILAPAFMACAPPLWVWAWVDDEEEDERTANDEPATPQQRLLKKLFEDAAGPEYLKFAYEPVYRLARRLVQFAVEGVPMCDMSDGIWEMIEEWKDIRRQGKAESGSSEEGDSESNSDEDDEEEASSSVEEEEGRDQGSSTDQEHDEGNSSEQGGDEGSSSEEEDDDEGTSSEGQVDEDTPREERVHEVTPRENEGAETVSGEDVSGEEWRGNGSSWEFKFHWKFGRGCCSVM